MKNKTITMIISCLALFTLTACGGNNTTPDNNNGNSNATVSADQTVTVSDNTADNSNTQTSDAGENNVQPEEEDFTFTYNGTDITINADMAAVEAALGEPSGFFESTECAFDGVAKTYNYGSFEIETYQIDDATDYIGTIFFCDDLVSTNEGISLFMTSQDVLDAYGTPDKEDANQYTYISGNSSLYIIFDANGSITSITYNTNALN